MRIGVIGTNSISHNFLSAAQKLPNVAVTAVYSRRYETGNAFAKAYGIKNVFTSLDDFLTSDTMDAVYIASPNACHKEQARAAILRKKHVLVEKPAAENLRFFRELRKSAEENGVVFLEAMRPLFSPALSVLQGALSEIGQIRSVSLSFCQYSSRYDRYKAGEILNAFNPALSNAALLDIGIYPIALMTALFGEPSDIQSRSVFMPNRFEGRGTILAAYDGMTASVQYSKIEYSAQPSFIVGESGSISIDAINRLNEVSLLPRSGEARLLYRESAENNMIYEIAAFRDMVDKGQSPIPYLNETEKVLHVMDTVRKQNGIVFPCECSFR